MEKVKLLDLRTKTNVHNLICGLEIDASGKILPAPFGALQPFHNTYVISSTAKPIYFGKGSVKLSQQAKDTVDGLLYQQALSIQFPNGDLLSANRIQEYSKVKFIYIKLSGGGQLFFGRNDYYQNTPISISIQNTPNLVKITYTCESVFPLGQTNGSADHLLPEDLPINFFTL